MPSIQVPAANVALSGNGDDQGYVTVTSNADFYPGATVWLKSDTANQECLITDLVSTNKIGLRFKTAMDGGARYTRSDCSAYTTVANSRIIQERQPVYVDLTYVKVNPN